MKHHAKKCFGQHFLHDEGVLNRIIKSIGPKKRDRMIEIGPGQGAMTTLLLNPLDHLTAVEIDRDLVAFLQKKNFSDKLTLLQKDILKFDLPKEKHRIVGNLPYNISTPLLFHLYDQLDRIEDMHFMLQKEVAERICAPVGDSQYGRLSVMSQLFCEAELLFLISPDSFNPPPKVESAFIRLTPHKNPIEIENKAAFNKVVTTAFNQRRKTIGNSLKHLVNKSAWGELKHTSRSLRPQELSIQQFQELSQHLR